MSIPFLSMASSSAEARYSAAPGADRSYRKLSPLSPLSIYSGCDAYISVPLHTRSGSNHTRNLKPDLCA